MLKIGDFSKLSRISIRMLRHYDEIDLLNPKTIDEWTGYRYYDETQLLAANRIQLLKNLGFGLSAIKELLLHFDDRDAVEKYLRIKKMELAAQEIELRERISLIDSTILNFKQEGNFMNYVVNLKTVPAMYVASIRKLIPEYTAEGMLWSALMTEVTKQKCKSSNPCYAMAVYHDKEYVEKDADVEALYSVDGNYEDTDIVKFKTVPAVEVAACIFEGSYAQIANVNESIAKWAKDNGYQFGGAAFWIYHKSPYETQNPDEYVTEVCFPVKKNS